ncbi:alpha/beta hydrolase [Oceanirhabdus sp. W0125-5]|uniref:alpha/beta hydrolase n=1 Tax=Oceanirhabdus sp. W0125-5 TaxID=2999116 RepID=UPI0022F30202|nr:alpha/beta hydrolase [Oceanirhabdus sp. W0125-5]WBW95708.1 alpha/beta hydrolase [Oceanirhabdus sp. W0125-5]
MAYKESIQSKILKKICSMVSLELTAPKGAWRGNKKLFERGCTIEKRIVNDVVCYMITPDDMKIESIVYYLHGGGYVFHQTINHIKFCTKMARESGIRVMIIDYSVAPENPYPAALDESIKVYKYLSEEYENTKIILMGDSAGGGLALATSIKIKEMKLMMPSKIILLSPFLDVSGENSKMVDIEPDDPLLSIEFVKKCGRQYAGDYDLNDPYISPIHGDFKGLPELSVYIGTHDILYPDCCIFEELAKKQGVKMNFIEYDKMIHVWMFYDIPEGKQAQKEIFEELKG